MSKNYRFTEAMRRIVTADCKIDMDDILQSAGLPDTVGNQMLVANVKKLIASGDTSTLQLWIDRIDGKLADKQITVNADTDTIKAMTDSELLSIIDTASDTD